MDVNGTATITGDSGVADELLGRQTSNGAISGVLIGSGLDLTAGVLSSTGGSSGVNSINSDSTSTQFLTNNGYVIITDTGSGNHNFQIDIGGLTSDSTFISDTANSLLADSTFLSDLANNATFIADLLGNTTFTSGIANNTNFITTLVGNSTFIADLTSNTTFISDIVSIVNSSSSISINLSTQVTGVLPVAHGGTGDSSFTAYAPIFGGTTSTGALQSGTVGTAGQVLTSNGAGALPTFQSLTPPSSAGPFGIYKFQTVSTSASNPSLAQVVYDPSSQSIYTLVQIGINGTNESLVISRLQQDPTSGIWEVTATATPTTGTLTFADNGMFVSGSNLYVVYLDSINTSQVQLGKYALDLTGFTHSSINLGATTTLGNNCIWTDGTDVWLFQSGVLKKHNISGNSNTSYTLSGFAATDIQSFIMNGTTLYGIKDVNGVKTIITATISGSTITQTASYSITAFDGTPSIDSTNIGSNVPCIYSSGASLNSIISYPVGAVLQSASGGNPFYTGGVQYAKFVDLAIAS